MIIEKFVIDSNFIKSNNYIVYKDGECFIIDLGLKCEKIIERIKHLNLNVKGILITHAHLDHMLGVKKVQNTFNTNIYISEKSIPLLKVLIDHGFNKYNIKKEFNYNELNIQCIENIDRIELADKIIKIHNTPGHTIDGISYEIDKNLFTGDTLFSDTIGSWSFNTGDYKELKESIRYICSFKDDYKIFPGHGNIEILSKIKESNNYVKRIIKKSK